MPFPYSENGQEIRVALKYKVGKKLGSGSFGEIYLGNFTSKLTLLEIF
jgi:hypothetical protein